MEDELLNEFIAESREHLSSIEDELLEIERQSENLETDLINKVFRAIHTIKGGSGFLDLTNLSGLSHKMETILSRIREKTLMPESLVVDALLEGVDRIKAMLDDVHHSNDLDTRSIFEKLENIISGKPGMSSDPVMAAKSGPARKNVAQSPVVSPPGKGTRSVKSAADITAASVSAQSAETVNAPAPHAEEEVKISETVPHAAGQNTEYIRIKVDILDRLMNLAGELVLIRNRQLLLASRHSKVLKQITQRLNLVTTDIQETVLHTRMQPMENILNKYTRLVRDLSRKLGKNITLELEGTDVELDKTILESITDPLTHIIRNSCDHGIEDPATRIKNGKSGSGVVKIKAAHEGGQIVIDISDDGRGIDPDVLRKAAQEKKLRTENELALMSDKEVLLLIFAPGFSTAKTVSDVSGRGVGMDVVRSGIEKVGGVIDLNSKKGAGTYLSIRLPLTLTIIQALIITGSGSLFAVPQHNLEELISLYDDEIFSRIETAGNRSVYRLRGCLLPLIELSEVLKRKHPFTMHDMYEITEQAACRRKEEYEKAKACESSYRVTFAVVKIGTLRYGLVIEDIKGAEEIVVCPLHHLLSPIPIYTGGTVLGDGTVSMILDPLNIARHAGIELAESIPFAQDAGDQSDTALILFAGGANEQCALPLDRVGKVRKVKMTESQIVGRNTFFVIDGQPYRIVMLSEVYPLSPLPDQNEYYFIIPKSAAKSSPFGIITSQIFDSGACNPEQPGQDTRYGNLQTMLINGKITLALQFEEIHAALG